ncbi:MAG: AzlD domain-containing protein [Fusobacterium sp.]|nr:AzlD domain-containing protein [Fusobacterium sp.]
MIDIKYSLIAIGIMAILTQFLRFLPFIIFSKNTPKSFLYLGKVLPYSIMAMLVVYCLRSINFLKFSSSLPEIISIFVIFIIHKLKHNTLLSIVIGTLCYMFLVQKIFI